MPQQGFADRETEVAKEREVSNSYPLMFGGATLPLVSQYG